MPTDSVALCFALTVDLLDMSGRTIDLPGSLVDRLACAFSRDLRLLGSGPSLVRRLLGMLGALLGVLCLCGCTLRLFARWTAS